MILWKNKLLKDARAWSNNTLSSNDEEFKKNQISLKIVSQNDSHSSTGRNCYVKMPEQIF